MLLWLLGTPEAAPVADCRARIESEALAVPVADWAAFSPCSNTAEAEPVALCEA
jgi:hypothetical protein